MRTRSVLTSILALGLLCTACGDDAGDDDGATAETTTSTGPASSEASSAASTTSSGSTSGTTEADETAGTTSTGGVDGCDLACEVHNECDARPIDDCLSVCNDSHTAYSLFGGECQDAYVALVACVGALDCRDYQAFDEGEDIDRPCGAENAELDERCSSVACDEVCTVTTECDPEAGTLEDCIEQCNTNLFLVTLGEGLACGAARTETLECVAGLSCEEYGEWKDAPGPDHPCADADLAEAAACDG